MIFMSVNLFIWVLKHKEIKVREKFFTVSHRNWYLMCADGTLYLVAGSVAECQDQRAKLLFPLAHHTKNFK